MVRPLERDFSGSWPDFSRQPGGYLHSSCAIGSSPYYRSEAGRFKRSFAGYQPNSWHKQLSKWPLWNLCSCFPSLAASQSTRYIPVPHSSKSTLGKRGLHLPPASNVWKSLERTWKNSQMLRARRARLHSNLPGLSRLLSQRSSHGPHPKRFPVHQSGILWQFYGILWHFMDFLWHSYIIFLVPKMI